MSQDSEVNTLTEEEMLELERTAGISEERFKGLKVYKAFEEENKKFAAFYKSDDCPVESPPDIPILNTGELSLGDLKRLEAEKAISSQKDMSLSEILKRKKKESPINQEEKSIVGNLIKEVEKTQEKLSAPEKSREEKLVIAQKVIQIEVPPMIKWSESEEDPQEDDQVAQDVNEGTISPELIQFDDYARLSQVVGAYGITLRQNEEGPLQRKFQHHGSMSVKEVIMYTEGLRGGSHISESKIAAQVDTLGKTIEVFKAHIKSLERIVSECKSQEKSYLDLIARQTSDIRQREKEKERDDQERKVMMRVLKDRIIELEDLIKSYKDDGSADWKSTKGIEEIKKSSKVEIDKGKAHKSYKENIATTKPESFKMETDNISESDEASPALLIIATGIEKKVSALCNHYKLTVAELNNLLRDFPQTKKEMEGKYKNYKEAYKAMHTLAVMARPPKKM
ncbi:TPA_asm: P2 [Arceuthobium sichuanense virus 2]|uniref:Protein 2 n=1 Tax=Picea virus 1 TaxID=2977979 RepID=A0A9N6YJN5_9RHAB|nr:TPA_asm: P2 [Arceuthobium sichuanense virus 2]DAZ90773.1 TPA_asm: protein 2 [Picea virus 1]